MAFDLSWLYEGRVLYARVFGAITDDDDATFDAAIEEFLGMGTGLFVHLITDYTGVEQIQTHVRPVREALPGTLAKDPRLGFRVACGAQHNPMLRYLDSLASFALKPCALRFDYLDEALDYLNAVDDTLPRLRALTHVAQGVKPA
jgi:hypothetical protein